MIQGKIAEKRGWEIDDEYIEEIVVTNKFDDDYEVADGRMQVKINDEIESDGNFLEIGGENLIGLHKIPKPKLSREILEIHERLNLTDPGHLGVPLKLPSPLPDDIQEMYNKSWSTYNINEFVAQLIPLDRELPDFRTEYCKKKEYHKNLPKASVISVFHNEALSMILRTVYSILIRTPPSLLREIVLVDDCSTHGETFESSIDEIVRIRT